MRISRLLVTLLTSFLLTAFTCNDKEIAVPNLRGYFWTTDEPGVSHRLYIDKQYKGILPHLASPVHDSTAINQGLNIPLEQGTHEVLVTDNNETVISKGEIKLKFTESNTNISSSWNNHRCMVKIMSGN